MGNLQAEADGELPQGVGRTLGVLEELSVRRESTSHTEIELQCLLVH
jgi:hypothetical protein